MLTTQAYQCMLTTYKCKSMLTTEEFRSPLATSEDANYKNVTVGDCVSAIFLSYSLTLEKTQRTKCIMCITIYIILYRIVIPKR